MLIVGIIICFIYINIRKKSQEIKYFPIVYYGELRATGRFRDR
jgi:hypothetical protein